MRAEGEGWRSGHGTCLSSRRAKGARGSARSGGWAGKVERRAQRRIRRDAGGRSGRARMEPWDACPRGEGQRNGAHARALVGRIVDAEDLVDEALQRAKGEGYRKVSSPATLERRRRAGGTHSVWKGEQRQEVGQVASANEVGLEGEDDREGRTVVRDRLARVELGPAAVDLCAVKVVPGGRPRRDWVSLERLRGLSERSARRVHERQDAQEELDR